MQARRARRLLLVQGQAVGDHLAAFHECGIIHLNGNRNAATCDEITTTENNKYKKKVF